jgi:hypothetical protein
VLERSGGTRSVGGVGPYLTLFARAGTSREAADAAVAALDIHELPTARGCTYVLPASDFALGLAVGQQFGGGEGGGVPAPSPFSAVSLPHQSCAPSDLIHTLCR